MNRRLAPTVLIVLTLPLAAATSVPASIGINGGNNQTGPINTTLPEALSLVVMDSSGSGVPGIVVNFGGVGGGGTVSAPAVRTDATGSASVTLTLGPIAGPVGVTAAIAGSAVGPVHFVETATANNTCPIAPPQISTIAAATDFGGGTAFASGSYLEIKGTNLALDTRPWATSDFNGSNAPTVLDGTKVSIDSIPAYVSYISATQINVQAPADPATGPMSLVVSNCAGSSSPQIVRKSNLAPSLLAPASFKVGGTQYAVALFASDLALGRVTYVGNPGFVASVASRTALPNDVIVIYGLGFGPVAPATPPGTIASGATTLTNFTASFGSTPASVSYAGLYPGFVGLYEFYLTVPNLIGGDYQISVSVAGAPVPQTVYLTIGN